MTGDYQRIADSVVQLSQPYYREQVKLRLVKLRDLAFAEGQAAPRRRGRPPKEDAPDE